MRCPFHLPNVYSPHEAAAAQPSTPPGAGAGYMSCITHVCETAKPNMQHLAQAHTHIISSIFLKSKMHYIWSLILSIKRASIVAFVAISIYLVRG